MTEKSGVIIAFTTRIVRMILCATVEILLSHHVAVWIMRENYSIKINFTRISRMGNGIESEVKQ
jgi:hypothetical protein